MALAHAGSGDLIDVRPLGSTLRQAITHTLVQSSSIEVFRMVLPAGKAIPAHRVPSAITVQCLEGTVEFEAHGRLQTMRAGGLIYLDREVLHALKAIEDASILVTLVHAPKHPEA